MSRLRRFSQARPLTSLRNRLALLIFATVLIAIGALYLYVAPGLSTRLLDDRTAALAAAARRYSGPIAATIDSGVDQAQLTERIDHAVLESGARVTLLSVAEAVNPPGPQLSTIADSSPLASAAPLRMGPARRAAVTGRLITATEATGSGTFALAALPLRFDGTVARVVVYSLPVDDIVRSVAIVRRQILVAGGIAIVLALIGGYLTARWLARRVRRLEAAAERIAGGEFGERLRIDSRDELGQLAATFNQMQDQLVALQRAREVFIATASHELRTPIFSLGGFVELLEDDDLDPATRRRFLDLVSEQVERLRKLSVSLLDLSRLESGSLQLRPEQVDLGELARSVAVEFEPALAARDAHLQLRLGPRIEATCDPVRVAQIVRILIDNALIHTAPGTRIRMTTSAPDGHVRLAVGDDGPGIPAAALPRIFEPFYTADDAQGSGLGLAIASELAERMGGQLTVVSAPGRTVFELALP